MSKSDLSGIIKTILIQLLIFFIIVAAITAFDLMSYTATDQETLAPGLNAKEKALIVYDPGIMGMGYRSACWMGDDLRSRGYNVTVAGIRSEGIEDARDYDMLIVIGPTYFGGPTWPVTAYLEKVQIKLDTRVGVFAISGLLGDDASRQMRAMLKERSVRVKASGSVSAWDEEAEEKSYQYIFSLLERDL